MKPFASFSLVFPFMLILIVSCASEPHIKEIAVLRYGDQEQAIIKTLGEGSEHLSFSYGGVDYHYRFYSTTMKEHQYALLFSNGSLLAVSEKIPNISVCTYQTAWDDCFSAAIAEMQESNMLIQSKSFSNALNEEQKRQQEEAIVMMVGGPLIVVAIPVGVGAMVGVCTGMVLTGNFDCFKGESDEYKKFQICKEALENIEQRLTGLDLTTDLKQVVDLIDGVQFSESLSGDSDEHVFNIRDDQKVIYGEQWSCSYDPKTHISAMYGSDNSRLAWISTNIFPDVASFDDSLLCRTAIQGNKESQIRLGDIFYQSYKTRKDIARAYAWYSLAADGDDVVESRLAILRKLMTTDELESTQAHRNALTIESCTQSLSNLKKPLQDAPCTLPQLIKSDPKKSSEHELQMYYNNLSSLDAKKWLCRAADSGNAEAQYRLGLLYEHGSEAVPKDLAKAYVWYCLSASAGNYMRPKDQADRIYSGLTTEQASDADGLLRQWRPGLCEDELVFVNPSN